MATMSFTAQRRFAGVVFTLLLSGLCLCNGAAGQGASPLVTSSVVNGLPPLASPAAWGQVWDTALSSNGIFLVADFEKGALYQFPAGGGPEINLIAAPNLGPGGGYANSGIALDPWNNLWIDNNWNGGLQRIPYNATTGTWNTAADTNPGSGLNIGGYYFQSAGLAINSSGTFVLSTENSAPQPALYSFTIDSSGNTSNLQTVITSLTARAQTLSIDNAGNIYIFENNGLSGILLIPAGTTGLANDKGLVDVEPVMPGTGANAGKMVPVLSSISGATVDAAGNLYVGDSSAGVYMVPNQSGTLNPAAWIMLTPAPPQGQIAVDSTRDTLYIPLPSLWNGLKYAGTAGLGNGELGSSAVGVQSTTPATVYYSFSGSVTPAKFVIQEDGVATPDFVTVSGGSCAVGTTYPIPASAQGNAVTNCSLNVALNPQHVGSVSAQLLMQTAQTAGGVTTYTTVATTTLHGTGLAPSIAATPALESTIGSGLKTPSQVTTDAMGNIYVADAGLGQVLMYAAGSGASSTGVSIGTGLTAPTGVAVDGNGDVFIADSTNVYEIPFASGALNTAGQITLVSGLGTQLKLAADGLGHLYVADPTNARVVELYNLGGSAGAFGQSETFLTAGFTAPSDVAVDSSNNLYVVDGANLFEISNGQQSTLLSSLSNVTGVAIDPSGAVYVSSSGGTERIPFVSGALVPADESKVAIGVTSPTAVAVDNYGNTYLADGTALSVHLVTANGTLNLGTLATDSSTATLPFTVVNEGNSPLTVTGYTSSNSLDYTATDESCVGTAIAAGANCEGDVNFNPGPGDQGTLTSTIGIASNSANAPNIVDATGVGAPLATSVSSISVTSTSEVINTQVTVKVAPSSGTGVPTGTVTVTFTTTTGTVGSVSGTLKDGSVTLTLSPVAAGSNTFTVSYQGDRTFGKSTANTTGTIAKSAISALALPVNPPPFLPYVLESDGSTPYDGSADYWEYNFVVTVSAAAGQPTGTVTFNDVAPGLSYTGVGCPATNDGVQPLNSSGQATFPTDCLPMIQNVSYYPITSTHTITPTYNGDANYLAYTGQPTTFQVVATPALIITSSAPSLNVTAGSTASASLTLTSILGYGFAGKNQQLNDYNFPVSLACDNLPPHSTCSFSYPNPDSNIPTAVDIPCAGTTAADDECSPGLATVTINTNVTVGTTTTSELAQPAPLTFAAMFGFGMIGLLFRRRINEKGRLLLMICLAIISGAFSLSLTACSTTNLSPASVLTTPKGTYAVTITAQQVGTQVITLPTGPVTIYGSQNQVSLPFTINVTVQ
ncbi:MAG: Ig-like domain repeat protein [Terracidiphilus sp.]